LAANTGGTAVLIAIRADAPDTQPGMIGAEASGNSSGIETLDLGRGNLSQNQAVTSLSVRVNLMAGPDF
jgi:hypothetical protein